MVKINKNVGKILVVFLLLIFSLAGCKSEEMVIKGTSLDTANAKVKGTLPGITKNVKSAEKNFSANKGKKHKSKKKDNKIENTKITPTKEATQKLCVDLEGAVAHPGVYMVDKDTRIFQVINMAGGPTSKGDVSKVNQAEIISDGQQIVVPEINSHGNCENELTKKEKKSEKKEILKVNINHASLEELITIKGIGRSKAIAVLEYRRKHGGFKNMEELLNIPGIKAGTLKKLESQIQL